MSFQDKFVLGPIQRDWSNNSQELMISMRYCVQNS